MDFSSYSFPDMYDEMGIDIGRLGCIMLDIPPIPVTSMVPDGENDLYYSPEADSFTKGAVAEDVAHVTLLYGLMMSGQAWKNQVDQVLSGWDLSEVQVDSVDYFDNQDPENPSYIIVANIKATDRLMEGNARISLLPHIDTFPEYKPHMTLAYIKKDDTVRDKWIKVLNEQLGSETFAVQGINYGK